MDESEFLRAKALVASSKSMHEISRLSEQLQIENSKVKLLAKQNSSPADIVVSLGSYFGINCMCFLCSQDEWLVVNASGFYPIVGVVGPIFESLALLEIYVDRKGLLSSEILHSAGLKRMNSRDLVFIPTQHGCVWIFYGRESGSLVLTIEEQSQWRDLFIAASNLVATAVERAQSDALLHEKALLGDMYVHICTTLYSIEQNQTPSVIFASLPKLLTTYFTSANASLSFDIDIFISEDTQSCVDSTGHTYSLQNSIIRDAFISKSPQTCRDPHSSRRHYQLDCVNSHSLVCIYVLPLFSSDALSAVLVFRFKTDVSDSILHSYATLTNKISPLLHGWISHHKQSLFAPKSNKNNVSNNSVGVLQLLYQVVHQVLESGEEALRNPQLQVYIRDCFECDWMVFVHMTSSGVLVIDEGVARQVNIDDLRGNLQEAFRATITPITPISTASSENGVKNVQIINSLDVNKSGLQSLLMSKIDGLCNICMFPLSCTAADSTVAICGRSWRTLSHSIIQSTASSLAGVFQLLLQSKINRVDSLSSSVSLQSVVEKQEAILIAINGFNNAIATAATLDPLPFRIALISAVKSFCSHTISSELYVFGGLISNSKWELSPIGVWAQDKSYIGGLGVNNQSEHLQSFSSKYRRFTVINKSICGVALHVVLCVSIIDGSSSFEHSHTAQSTVSAFLPYLISIFIQYYDKIFNCPIDSEMITFPINSTNLVNQLNICGHLTVNTFSDINTSESVQKVVLYSLPLVHYTSTCTTSSHTSNQTEKMNLKEIANPHRVLASSIVSYITNLIQNTHGKNEFYIGYDTTVNTAIVEHIHRTSPMSTSSSMPNISNLEDSIFGFHLHTMDGSQGTVVVTIVLYGSNTLVSPWHISSIHQQIHVASTCFHLFDSLNPHLISGKLFHEIEKRELSQRRLADELTKLYCIDDSSLDYSGMVEAILLTSQFTDVALECLLRSNAQLCQHEVISDALRLTIHSIKKNSSSNQSFNDEDVVIHWLAPILPNVTASYPITSSIKTPALSFEHSSIHGVTAGLISPDMVELVQNSGKTLELDMQTVGLKYHIEKMDKVNGAKISYVPIFHDTKEKGVVPIVVAVVQYVGATQFNSTELTCMQNLSRQLTRTCIDLHPNSIEISRYEDCLLTILDKIKNTRSFLDLENFFHHDFDEIFTTYCCMITRSACGVFHRNKANITGSVKSIIKKWNDVDGVCISKSCSLSMESIDDILFPFTVSPSSLLSVQEEGTTSRRNKCAVYIVKVNLSDEAGPEWDDVLLVERGNKPCFYDLSQLQTLKHTRTLIFESYLSRAKSLRLDQRLSFESFCRSISQCEEFNQIKTLVADNLADSIECLAVSILILRPVPAHTIATTTSVDTQSSHVHSSRNNDERMAERCLASKTYIGCKHGTLSSHLPCVFLPIYEESQSNSDDICQVFYFESCVFKLVFTDVQSYEYFISSEHHVDTLKRYMDRAIEAATYVRNWIDTYILISQNKIEKGSAEGLRHLSSALVDMFSSLGSVIASASEMIQLLDERDTSNVADHYIYSSHQPNECKVYSIPSLAAYLADSAEMAYSLQEHNLISCARLHWCSNSNDDDWQTCQHAYEIDEKLYLRLDVTKVLGVMNDQREETISSIRSSSPTKRQIHSQRDWVRGRSNISTYLSKTIQSKQVVVTRISDVNNLSITEEVLWLWIDTPCENNCFILELRLQNNSYTSLVKLMQHDTIVGVYESVYYTSKSSTLYSKMRLTQQVLGSTISSIIRKDKDIIAIKKERDFSTQVVRIAEILENCILGFFSPHRGDESAPLKASIESVLTELCKMPHVIEVRVECVDIQERVLLFKSTLKPTANNNSMNGSSIDASIVSKEYTLDHRDVKGNLVIHFSSQQTGQSEGNLSQLSSVDVFATIAKAIARRAFELNKVRKNKAALKLKIEEYGVILLRMREMEDAMKIVSESRDNIQTEVDALVDKNHILHAQLSTAKEDVTKAIKEKNAVEYRTQQSLEKYLEESRKKKAHLMHTISVLESDVTRLTSDLANMTMEKERCMQNLSMTELRLQDAKEDHEHMLKSLQSYKSKRAKECADLQKQSSNLLSKLSVTENELIGTRKLYDHKKVVAEDMKVALMAAQAELLDLKHRLNLA